MIGPQRPTGKIVVTHATGPGPNARRGWTVFFRDAAWYERELGRLEADFSARWIGEWHSHTWGSPFPSWRDIATARHLLAEQLGVRRFVLLIVSPRADRVEAGACSITEDAISPLRLAGAPPDAAVVWRMPTWRWRHEQRATQRRTPASSEREPWDLQGGLGEARRAPLEENGGQGASHENVRLERSEAAVARLRAAADAAHSGHDRPETHSEEEPAQAPAGAGGKPAEEPAEVDRGRGAIASGKIQGFIRRRPWTAAAVGFALAFGASHLVAAPLRRRAGDVADRPPVVGRESPA